jgi:AhpD family alkylhydroperoxidase
MSLKTIAKGIPDYMADLRQNFEQLLVNPGDDGLSQEQRSAVAVALSYHLRNEMLINCFRNEAKMCLEESNITDIRAAAIMITRNNLFYRVITTAQHPDIVKQTIALHETALSNTNMDKITLMMAILAVSMLNNCNKCIHFYTDKLLKRGVSVEAITSIARIMAVMSTTANALEIDALRTYDYGSW